MWLARGGVRHPSILFTGAAINSSKTWKSGERCERSGSYRCETCRLAGRHTVRDFEAGIILPMCDVGPEKDTTWRLLKATKARTGS